jgi:hypothetical protein
MPRKLPLTKEVKARITSTLDDKLAAYCQKYDMSESAVIREALKKFLRNTATTC